MAKLSCPLCSQRILQCKSNASTLDITFLCSCGYKLVKNYEQIKAEDKRILELQLNKIKNCPDEFVQEIMKLIDLKVTYYFGEVWSHTMEI